jgi:hypothetical protein
MVNFLVYTNVAAMTDAELADYRQLLGELKALLPEEVPKVIEGIVVRGRGLNGIKLLRELPGQRCAAKSPVNGKVNGRHLPVANIEGSS